MMDIFTPFQQKKVSSEQAMALIAQMKAAALPLFVELKKLKDSSLAEVSDAVVARRYIPEQWGHVSLERYSTAHVAQALYQIQVIGKAELPKVGRREILIEFGEKGTLCCNASWTRGQSDIRSFDSSLRKFNLGLFGIGAIQPQRIAAKTDKILKFVVDALNHT